MPETSKAAVLVGPHRIEIRELPLPEIGPDDGLMRVEACGVCGADWPPYLGELFDSYEVPLILGHEVVGRVERIGARASERWGVVEGDRIILEEPLPCGDCDWCRAGHYQGCAAPRYGGKAVRLGSGLWGGYSEYMYLDPHALVHKMSTSVPVELAPLFVPISNGIYWVQKVGGAGPGSTVLIEGPGQHGLGCVVGAKEAGADCVIVTGLARDARRLALARELGADFTIAIDTEDAVARVREITDGKMAGTVVNVTAGAPRALSMAVDLAGAMATVVVAGTAHAPAQDFMPDKIMAKELTLKGVRGRYADAIKPAIALIESGKYPLHKLSTHTFPIEATEQAIKTVGGQGEADAIHVSVISRRD